jgi:sugar/nucleoside kinase (ribokinase family)
MVEKERRPFGLVGTITQDVITQASGRVLAGLGGILYQTAGLCGLGLDVALYSHVSQDLLPQVMSLLDRWPTCDSAGIGIVPGPGNRVFLHYPEEGERIEVLESHVPPLQPDRLLSDLTRIRFLILVINSGFDLTLQDWQRVVRRAECPIWLDVHSLVLTPELHSPRRYRSLPEWQDWAKGVTYLQANLKEVAAMLGEPERVPSRERLDYFGETALELGLRGVFITLGSEGVLVMIPGSTRRVASPRAGEVVDTTGCGDIFCAGTAALLASGADPVEAAGFGVELASEGARVSGIEQTHDLIRKRLFRA